MTGLLTQHHPGENISIPEAAFRWIYNHSALDGARGDAVVLGASRLEQVATNLELSRAQPLHASAVSATKEISVSPQLSVWPALCPVCHTIPGCWGMVHGPLLLPGETWVNG